MEVKLITRQWLKRVIEISDGDRLTRLVYSGRGFGAEKVMVDGIEATDRSNLLWFVPRFEVADGADRYVFQVRVWPWLALRSLLIEKNGVEIYAEGTQPYPVSRLSETTQVVTFAALFTGPAVLFMFLLR